MVVIKLLNRKFIINEVGISYSLVRPKLSDYSVKKILNAFYIKLTVDTYIRVCVGCYVSQAVCGGSGHRAAQWVSARTTGWPVRA